MNLLGNTPSQYSMILLFLPLILTDNMEKMCYAKKGYKNKNIESL